MPYTLRVAKGHRMFAAMWDCASRREDVHTRDLRRHATSGLTGRVLEVGAGTGANWRHLPDGIDYTGVEPDANMRRRAMAHAEADGSAFALSDGSAEALPYADGSFDSVLCTFVLCSVDDQAKGLAEVLRVLKPGGTFHYAEHVRPAGFKGSLLGAVTPLWARVFGNCHPNRRTGAAIAAAGFEMESEGAAQLHGLPHIYGVARKPG